MLKFTYTDLGLHLVRLPDALEAVISQRSLLAVRIGQAVHLEPSYAAFLVPAHWGKLTHLKAAIAQAGTADLAVTPVDQECVEINLRGLWLASSIEAQEGIFLVALPDEVEVLVEQAWTLAEVYLTVPK